MVPTLVVATTWPFWLVERIALLMPVNQVVPRVASVELEFAKFWSFVQEFASVSNVELAAVTVMEPPTLSV